MTGRLYIRSVQLFVFIAYSLFTVSQHLYTKSFSLGVRQLMPFIRAKMRSKELSLELRDRIVRGYRSGEGYQKMSAALKVAAIILKWKRFGTTKTIPRVGHPAKLSNQGRRV